MAQNPLVEWAERIQRLEAKAFDLANTWAGELRREAVARAPWHDQFGHARAGLHGYAERYLGGVRIVLAHSVRYGVFLENPKKAYTVRPKRKKALWWPGLAHPIKMARHPAMPAKYAIIIPTFKRNIEKIGKSFERIFGR